MDAANKRQAALIACYETICNTSELMLEAAQNADWKTVERGERVCGQLALAARELGDSREVLDAHGRRARLEILLRVLKADSRIRNLRDPWLVSVEGYVGRRSKRRNDG